MKLIPINKFLLVEKIEHTYSSLIPEELRDEISPFMMVKVISFAHDCDKLNYKNEETIIVVQTNGLEEIKLLNKTFLVISEKFVIGEMKNYNITL